MAAYKKKQVKQREKPKGKLVNQAYNPEQYYKEKPAWSFANCDQIMWAFTKEHIGDLWDEIFPCLQALEKQTWNEILVIGKKKNHSIDTESLNKVAQDRLAERYIECNSLISLRITGTHRLYGYITGRVFNVLWYDDKHGNNDSCVCRSNLKHT